MIMRLSVNVVHGGCYVKAGDDLPSDFILPEHLERFAVYDEPPLQVSRVDSFSSVEGHERHRASAREICDELHRE